MPLYMRLPKLKGFTNRFRVEYQVVNLEWMAAHYPKGGAVTPEDLVAKGAVRKGELVKVLGDGEIGVKLQVSAHGSRRPRRRRSRRPAAAPRSSRTTRALQSRSGRR